MNSPSPTQVLVQACRQGCRLFQRLEYGRSNGSRPVFDIRLPEPAVVVDFSGSRTVDPERECELLVEMPGGRGWVLESAQSVFVSGESSAQQY